LSENEAVIKSKNEKVFCNLEVENLIRVLKIRGPHETSSMISSVGGDKKYGQMCGHHLRINRVGPCQDKKVIGACEVGCRCTFLTSLFISSVVLGIQGDLRM
jgi:hypothetical protein